jgi:hypothetical protein
MRITYRCKFMVPEKMTPSNPICNHSTPHTNGNIVSCLSGINMANLLFLDVTYPLSLNHVSSPEQLWGLSSRPVHKTVLLRDLCRRVCESQLSSLESVRKSLLCVLCQEWKWCSKTFHVFWNCFANLHDIFGGRSVLRTYNTVWNANGVYKTTLNVCV